MPSEQAALVVAKQRAQQGSVYTCLVMLAAVCVQVDVDDENEDCNRCYQRRLRPPLRATL